MDGKAGLRIAYSNQKLIFDDYNFFKQDLIGSITKKGFAKIEKGSQGWLVQRERVFALFQNLFGPSVLIVGDVFFAWKLVQLCLTLIHKKSCKLEAPCNK